MVLLTACEYAVAPRTLTKLEEIRRDAPNGYGAFTGVVRGLRVSDSTFCLASSPPLPGIRVDLGIWHASPAVYRDTVTGLPPSTLAEQRFEVVGSTITDAAGQFTFAGLPRRRAFAFRAIPPANSPFRLGYGISLYGIGNADTPNHPSLCLTAR
jgi:protocatechuate 3,4-dioxygenase beta subunit